MHCLASVFNLVRKPSMQKMLTSRAARVQCPKNMLEPNVFQSSETAMWIRDEAHGRPAQDLLHSASQGKAAYLPQLHEDIDDAQEIARAKDIPDI